MKGFLFIVANDDDDERQKGDEGQVSHWVDSCLRQHRHFRAYSYY